MQDTYSMFLPSLTYSWAKLFSCHQIPQISLPSTRILLHDMTPLLCSSSVLICVLSCSFKRKGFLTSKWKMSAGILHCLIKKKRNKTKKRHPASFFYWRTALHSWEWISVGTRPPLSVPGLVTHCNLGTSPAVVAVEFATLKMLPQSHERRAATGCAVHTGTCYTGKLTQKSGRIWRSSSLCNIRTGNTVRRKKWYYCTENSFQ